MTGGDTSWDGSPRCLAATPGWLLCSVSVRCASAVRRSCQLRSPALLNTMAATFVDSKRDGIPDVLQQSPVGFRAPVHIMVLQCTVGCVAQARNLDEALTDEEVDERSRMVSSAWQGCAT